MSRIIQPAHGGLILPKRLLQEEVDRTHRMVWEDEDRYPKQKAKALRYIPVRAQDVHDHEKLLREVARIFHDDLLNDPDVRAAAEKECYAARAEAQRAAERDAALAAQIEEAKKAAKQPVLPSERGGPRGDTRGLDVLTDDILEDLEWQQERERIEP